MHACARSHARLCARNATDRVKVWRWTRVDSNFKLFYFDELQQSNIIWYRILILRLFTLVVVVSSRSEQDTFLFYVGVFDFAMLVFLHIYFEPTTAMQM